MRLISLEISNFRVIKGVRLDFPDKVIGIIGPNGAGKSSLIEAIAWALYGNQAARTGKDEIKSAFASSGENCQVTLDFSVNEEQYRVVRRLVGKTERAEVELYRGEAAESVGVNETKAYVGQLLGLDWRGFLTSFLARQQELNALSDLQPSKRRDHIAGMLGIERLDKAIQKVKEDTRLNQEKGHFLQTQLAEKGQVEKRIEELVAMIGDLEQPTAKLYAEQQVAEAALKDVKKKFEESQRQRDQLLNLKARVEAEERTGRNLTDQLKGLKEELAELRAGQVQVEDLSRRLKLLPSAKAELDRLRELKSQVALKDELSARKSDLEKKAAEHKMRLEDISRRLDELQARLGAFPESLDRLAADARARLEEERDSYTRINADLKATQAEIGRLKQQLDSITELGPQSECERCGRPFGEDYGRIKEHLGRELNQLETAAAAKERELQASRDKGELLKQKVTDADKQQKQHYQGRVDLESAERDRDTLSAHREETVRDFRQVSAQLQKYESVVFDPARFDAAEARVEEFEKLQQECNRLKGLVSRTPNVETAIADVSGKYETVQHNLRRYSAEVSSLGITEEEFEQTGVAFNRAQEKLETVTKEYLASSKEKELNERELQAKRERLSEFDRTANELERARGAQFLGEKLGRLFAEFRKQLIASIRPSLADLSSRLLAEMTDDRYNLVELDDQYDLRVMDGGVFYGVDRFSGGEKDLANLCLRLAISLALTESAGLDRSFVILDEVFGSQDSQRKDLILQAMGRLKVRFPQILLITHVDDVKDGVEEIVEVLPTGSGWSEVRVNGSSA